MQAILANTTTKYKRYYSEVEVISSDNLYNLIELDTSNLEDGEYMLTVYSDDNKVVANDLLRIGDYNNSTKTQYKIEKKYTQYVRK